MQQTSNHTCGYVSIVGMPNAGKSTLMNRYLKEKVSIVTPKPQTTRANVTCFLTTDSYQIIFIDTPGILKPRYKMQEVMKSFITNAVDDADIMLILIDASHFKTSLPEELVNFIENVKKKKLVIALNKIDILKKIRLLELIAYVNEIVPDVEIYPISAKTGDGTDELLEEIINLLPSGPPLFPVDLISYEPERFFVSELIREAVFISMDEEIPYSSGVIIEKFEDKTSIIIIYATILVEKKSQKPIIIGKGGATIKKIGTMSRHGIEEFLGTKVYLDLHVKVRDDWRNKHTYLREIGLVRR